MTRGAAENRRGFVRRAAGALFGVVAGIPALAALLHPALARADRRWVRVGRLADVPEGAARRVGLEIPAAWERRRQAVFLVRRGEDLLALDARCTHAGCRVAWEGNGFVCPCHGGAFDAAGAPVRGPATRPLARLAVRVENGEVFVQP